VHKFLSAVFLMIAVADVATSASAYAATDEAVATHVKVALLQMDPQGNDQEANLRKADQFCRQAAQKGADIALMPEMWNIGYTRFRPGDAADRQAFWDQAIDKDSPWVQHFRKLAVELDMAIAVAYEQQWAPRPRNAVTIFDRHGNEVLTYAKVHTSDFKAMERNMTPGEDFYVGSLDTKQGAVQVGAMICFDREHPESARILMLKGAELILTPNCCGLDDLRLQQFRTRAWENVLGVAMANHAHPYQNGHSVAYSSSGKCLVMAGEDEGVYLATFDMAAIRKHRRKSIHGNAYRRPHRYQLLLTPEKDDVWQRIDGIGQPYDGSKR
jgi:predicted amidohydrolase